MLAGCAGAIDLPAAGDVKHGIADLRRLSFTQDVPFVIRSNEAAQQMMLAKLSRDNTDEELRLSSAAGVMTGLFPPGTELKSAELKLMRQQVAGFYDPDEKVMVEVHGQSVLGTSMTGRSEFAGELLQAHELTHALQDQHFGLQQMLNKVKNNDDEEIALHALIEGDATLAGLAYVSGGMDDENAHKIVEHFSALPDSFEPESSGTPLALSMPLMFQYSAGTRFVAEAWNRGGWAEVDTLYHDPPTSTQQIMDPSLYFDHFTPPLEIAIRGYQAALPGWKKADDDSFGELLIKIILQRNLDSQAAALRLPAEWRGDHMIMLEQDRALTLLWMIAFSDDAAAKSFAEAYDPLLDHLKDASAPHRVAQRDNVVLVMIGPGASSFDQVAPAVWQASTIHDPCAAPPAEDQSHIRCAAPGSIITAKDLALKLIPHPPAGKSTN